MLAIFPLYDLNIDQPENVGLIRKSVSYWIGSKSNPAHSGYTYTGSASMFASLEDGVARMVRVRRKIEPQLAHYDAYRQGYSAYLELYERLAPMFI